MNTIQMTPISIMEAYIRKYRIKINKSMLNKNKYKRWKNKSRILAHETKLWERIDLVRSKVNWEKEWVVVVLIWVYSYQLIQCLKTSL